MPRNRVSADAIALPASDHNINRRTALLGAAATVAALAMPAVVAAEISPEPAFDAPEPVTPDAELLALGAEADRLSAAIAEAEVLLAPTDAEADRLRNDWPETMKFTQRDFLWFGKANGPGWSHWSPGHIDQLMPYVPQNEFDNPAWPNARLAELKAAREAWAYRNREFSIRTGRNVLLDKLEQLLDERCDVDQRIGDLTAGSMAGLLVKAKLARRENGRLWETPKTDLELEDEYVRNVLDNLLQLAGASI